MSKPRTYTGSDIEISFDMSRCIHARNCFLKLPEVFDPSRRPWVDPDAAPAEDIAAMIRTCPSGALTFAHKNGAKETPPKLNRVAVLENGPLSVHGDIDIGGEPQTRATLCRCGQTKNPPYCDYSHVDAGFEATGEPKPEAKEEADLELGAALVVAGREDGPLLVKGPMEITTGTGRRIAKVEMAPLCRCGLSKNKPYCDGSHRDGGFKVPEV